MCLPLCCLRKIVQFEAWLVFLLSLTAIAGAIIVTVFESKVINNLNDIGFTIDSAYITPWFWSFAVVLFLFAICGIIGGKKKNGCLLAIFNLGNITLFLAFFCLGLVVVIVSVGLDPIKNVVNECKSQQDIDNLYASAESLLCKTGCKCYFTGNINNVSQAVTNYSPSDSNLPTHVQECNGFNENDLLAANALGWLEGYLDCSGWCTAYPIQVFGNVNKPVKNYNNPCINALYDKLENFGITIGDILLSISAVLGLFIIFTCCLCCHPQSPKKTADQYIRMAYYDE